MKKTGIPLRGVLEEREYRPLELSSGNVGQSLQDYGNLKFSLPQPDPEKRVLRGVGKHVSGEGVLGRDGWCLLSISSVPDSIGVRGSVFPRGVLLNGDLFVLVEVHKTESGRA